MIDDDQDPETLKSRTIRGGGYAMITEGLDFALRFGSIFVLARLLMPDAFGLIAMVSGFTIIAERFKDLGLSTATLQRREISLEQVSTLFWINVAVGTVLMLIIASLAFPLAWFYDDKRLIPITLAISTGFFFSGLGVQHFALLRRRLKYARMGAITITSSALSVVIAVILAANGFGYWALVAREVMRNLFVAIGTWISYPWLPSLPSRQPDIGSMLSFGGHVTATNILYHFSASLDQILIGKFFGAAPLGVYRQGVNLVSAPLNSFTQPVVSVGESALCRLQEEPLRFRRFYRKTIIGLGFVTIPTSLFLAVYAHELVLLALGPNWTDVAPIFRIMAIVTIFRPVATTFGPVMIACGHSRRVLWMGVLTSITTVTFVAASVPFGIMAVAFAHVGVMYLLLLPKMYWSFKGTPVTMRLFFEAVGHSLLAGLVMTGVLVLLREVTIIDGALARVGLGTLVGFISYLAYWAVIPGARTQLKEIISDMVGHLPVQRLLGRRI